MLILQLGELGCTHYFQLLDVLFQLGLLLPEEQFPFIEEHRRLPQLFQVVGSRFELHSVNVLIKSSYKKCSIDAAVQLRVVHDLCILTPNHFTVLGHQA